MWKNTLERGQIFFVANLIHSCWWPWPVWRSCHHFLHYTWAICLREKCTFVEVQQCYVSCLGDACVVIARSRKSLSVWNLGSVNASFFETPTNDLLCDISWEDRTFLSLYLLNKSVAEATSSKKPRVESCAESSCPRKVVETQHGEIYVGDMVGLVYSAEDAVVFVGSVVKIRANEVLLKWHYHLNFFFIIQKYNVCLIFFPNFKAKFVHLPDFFAILICQFYGRH